MSQSVIFKCNKRIIVLNLYALDISFVVNLLARFSYAPTQRHWSGIKTIFRYLKGTIDLGLFYPYREKAKYEKLAAFKNCRRRSTGRGTTVERSTLGQNVSYSLCRKSL